MAGRGGKRECCQFIRVRGGANRHCCSQPVLKLMHLHAVHSKEVEELLPFIRGVMRNELEEALSSSQRRCRPDRLMN